MERTAPAGYNGLVGAGLSCVKAKKGVSSIGIRTFTGQKGVVYRLVGVMLLRVGLCPFEISAEIPGHRLGEGIHHGDDPFFIRGRHHAASLLFADLSWFFFASSHNQNTSQGCKPESFFEKFILFLRSSDYTKGVYKKVGQSTQGRLARNRVCVAFSLILIEGHRCWCKNNFLTHLIFSLSA